MNKKMLLEIRAMASQQYTVETIAEKLKITKGEAEYYVWQMGYRAKYDEPKAIERMRYQPEHGIKLSEIKEENDKDERKIRTWKITDEEMNRIRHWMDKGFTATEIALKLGKHRDTIVKAIKKIEVDDNERR